MATLFNKEDTPDSTADIKHKLRAAYQTVERATEDSSINLENHSREHAEWKHRLLRVSRIMQLTKSEEAREDLKVLKEQAETFHTHFGEMKAKEKEFHASLAKQLGALQNAYQKFETMERRQELKRDIARLAGNTGAGSGGSAEKIDFREIENIIHTATALIELKEEKAITS